MRAYISAYINVRSALRKLTGRPPNPRAPAPDQIRLSQKAGTVPAASAPTTPHAALRASAPLPARSSSTTGNICKPRRKTAKEKFYRAESAPAESTRPPNAPALPPREHHSSRPLDSPRYSLRTTVARARTDATCRRRLPRHRLHQLRSQPGKLRRRHARPRMYHHVPPARHFMPVHPQNFPQASPYAVPLHRVSQRLLDAPSKPADRETILAYKQRELAARPPLGLSIHRVIFGAAHDSAFARQILPRRVRRA